MRNTQGFPPDPFSGRMTGLRGQEREICTEAAERPHDPGQGSQAKPPEQEAQRRAGFGATRPRRSRSAPATGTASPSGFAGSLTGTART